MDLEDIRGTVSDFLEDFNRNGGVEGSLLDGSKVRLL